MVLGGGRKRCGGCVPARLQRTEPRWWFWGQSPLRSCSINVFCVMVKISAYCATLTKSSKPARMFQWDTVDTSPDLVGQNVLKTFEMAIRHNRWKTRMELESVFCRWTYCHLCSKIFFWPSYRGNRPHCPCPQWILCHNLLDGCRLKQYIQCSEAVSYTTGIKDIWFVIKPDPKIKSGQK